MTPSRTPVFPRRALHFVLTTLVLTLSGCANYAGIKSDRQLTANAQLPSARSLPSQGGQWPASGWVNPFGDAQLRQLIDEALAGSPAIAQARARLERAASYIQVARARLEPSLDARYGVNRERYSSNALYPPPYGGGWFTENTLFLNASFELDLWGKNRERVREAVSRDKSFQAEMALARLELTAAVARAYNQLAQLDALREVTAREIANREQVGRITNRRVSAGLDTEVERRTAEGNVASSQTNLAALDGRIAVKRYQLAALLGAGPDRGLQIAPPTLGAGAPVALPDDVPADLVARRPDIVAARWLVEAAQHDVKAAKADFYPDLNLAALAGFDAFDFGRFLTAGSRQIQAGPAIHLPIFEGGALRSRLRGKYADYDEAVANYNKTLIDALNDVATQIASIRAVDHQLGDALRAYDAAQRAYDLAVVRYRAGLSPQLQVLLADSNRLAREQTLVTLRTSRRDAQLALAKALGGGFNADDTALATARPSNDAGAPGTASRPTLAVQMGSRRAATGAAPGNE